MNRVYWLVLFLLCFNINAKDKEQIDEILNKSLIEFSELRFIESLKTAKIALELSENNKYSKGIAKANIYIAKVLLEIGAYNESLAHIKEAEKESFFSTYVNIQVESHRLRGRVYGSLKMYDLSIGEFYKQLSLSNEIKDDKMKKISTCWAHENLAHVFSLLEKRDSVWNHLMIQQNILKKMNEKEVYYDLITTYAKIANEYILHKSYSKAQYYLDNSIKLVRKYNSPYQYYTLEKYGDLERMKGDNVKAIKYYEESLANAKALKDKDAIADGYRKLADYYVESGYDIEKSNKYYYEYNRLSDSLDTVNKKAVETALDQILNSSRKKQSDQHENYIYYYLMFGVSVLIMIFVLIKSRKKKLNILMNEPLKLEKLDVIAEEIQFNDLINYAKTNSPEFIVLFEKMYPAFVNELRKINPSIRSSELSFCAMTFLNFSTKDIADYTFVTTRAVQIRKNRLRKKYNIPSEQDFNTWMRYLGSNKLD
ncbi:hypothetical protein CMU16_17380 [Elizabethkingia anophelis]|nr:hypothetical protein [Elizabethkingia anophelis]